MARGDLGSIPGWVIPKTQKMVLDASLLNTQHYKVRIKGKVEQSREGVAPSPTHWCSSYRKGSLWVTLDYGRQLTLLIKEGGIYYHFLSMTRLGIEPQSPGSLANTLLIRPMARIYIYIYIYIDVYICINIFMCVHTHTHAHTHTHTYACVCMCVYVCVCESSYEYISKGNGLPNRELEIVSNRMHLRFLVGPRTLHFPFIYACLGVSVSDGVCIRVHVPLCARI